MKLRLIERPVFHNFSTRHLHLIQLLNADDSIDVVDGKFIACVNGFAESKVFQIFGFGIAYGDAVVSNIERPVYSCWAKMS
ncbi:MAG: hypothetical protein ONB05_00895 [candidate division KSB1 bacterium]|nr:hypothetical protein [candidate division KSB1 bacterium]